MKAVMVDVPASLLADRKRSGADQWDEMWAGVLHMAPSPVTDHQDLEWALETWLRQRWARQTGGRVYHQINVARPSLRDWRTDYRVPDLVLLTQKRFPIDLGHHFDGGPDAVVEIKSPDDETYDKIPFYAEVGVRELWVVDRDLRGIELLVLDEGPPTIRASGDGGWVRSALGIELRAAPERRLALRLAGRPRTVGYVP